MIPLNYPPYFLDGEEIDLNILEDTEYIFTLDLNESDMSKTFSVAIIDCSGLRTDLICCARI